MVAITQSTQLDTTLPNGVVHIGEVMPDVFGMATIRQLTAMYQLRSFETREILLRGQVPIWFDGYDWLVYQMQFQSAWDEWRTCGFPKRDDLICSSLLRAHGTALGGVIPRAVPKTRVDPVCDLERDSRPDQGHAQDLETARPYRGVP